MVQAVNTLTWNPYPQEGQSGALIATVLVDASVDAVWTIPTVGLYNFPGQPQQWADGVIISNDFNNGPVAIAVGPLASIVPPYQREAIALSKSVGADMQITLGFATGIVQLLFYKGTPPINPNIYNYQGAAASVVPDLSPQTISLTAPVAIVAGVYSTGPQLNQGPIGTWFASGTVTVLPTGGGDRFAVRLWDGTNIADETVATLGLTNPGSISVSGLFVFPVAGIRISVTTITNPGTILDVSVGGTTKVSTLSAFRTA